MTTREFVKTLGGTSALMMLPGAVLLETSCSTSLSSWATLIEAIVSAAEIVLSLPPLNLSPAIDAEINAILTAAMSFASQASAIIADESLTVAQKVDAILKLVPSAATQIPGVPAIVQIWLTGVSKAIDVFVTFLQGIQQSGSTITALSQRGVGPVFDLAFTGHEKIIEAGRHATALQKKINERFPSK